MTSLQVRWLLPLGCSQKTMLRQQLFTIYVNDLYEGIKCNKSRFPNDSKLGGIVGCEEDETKLQWIWQGE